MVYPMQQFGLSACCLISRVSFLVENNFIYTSLSQESKNHLISKASETINTIKGIFAQNQLNIVRVNITSDFFGTIESQIGIEIILTDVVETMPVELYKQLLGKFKLSLKKSPPTFSFGFLKRGIKKINNEFKCSITAGSHSVDNNNISFDVSTYEILGVEPLCKKLIHELLHDIGFDESKVLAIQDAAYIELKDAFIPFVQTSLYPTLVNAKTQLFERIGALNTLPLVDLFEIAKVAALAGFPVPAEIFAEMDVTHPFTNEIHKVPLF